MRETSGRKNWHKIGKSGEENLSSVGYEFGLTP
jgi:hypothetical protein